MIKREGDTKMETVKIAFFDTKPYDTDYFDPLLKNPAFPLKLKYLGVRLGPDTAALASGYDGKRTITFSKTTPGRLSRTMCWQGL
jgi:hypothetical protein